LLALPFARVTPMHSWPSRGRARSSRTGPRSSSVCPPPPRRAGWGAALRRAAPRLGLPRSLRGVRLERTLHTPPGSAGSPALDNLRFQQTAGGRRVVWSRLDVTLAGGEVRLIDATVVPVGRGRPAIRPKVSRIRALAIARRTVRGRERARAAARYLRRLAGPRAAAAIGLADRDAARRRRCAWCSSRAAVDHARSTLGRSCAGPVGRRGDGISPATLSGAGPPRETHARRSAASVAWPRS
jgi:hypothetical protein